MTRDRFASRLAVACLLAAAVTGACTAYKPRAPVPATLTGQDAPENPPPAAVFDRETLIARGIGPGSLLADVDLWPGELGFLVRVSRPPNTNESYLVEVIDARRRVRVCWSTHSGGTFVVEDGCLVRAEYIRSDPLEIQGVIVAVDLKSWRERWRVPVPVADFMPLSGSIHRWASEIRLHSGRESGEVVVDICENGLLRQWVLDVGSGAARLVE